MDKCIRLMSHPSWVCGLKLADTIILDIHQVTPFVGVWIETAEARKADQEAKSHPSWVCGLKLLCISTYIIWVKVTPFVGVWIETRTTLNRNIRKLCHTLRGCVD